MDLSLAFAAFAAGMMASRIFGVTMIAPLALGLVAFAGVVLYRGFKLRNILGMAWNGARGAGVYRMQQGLVELGYLDQAPNGLYDARSQAAVYACMGDR